MTETTGTTSLVRRWSSGDKQATAVLLSRLYDELIRTAAVLIRRVPETTHPESLVSDLFVRLSDGGSRACHDTQHFKQLSGKIMRELLIDQYRKRVALMRGGGQQPAAIEPVRATPEPEWIADIAVRQTLESMTAFDPRGVEMVRLHRIEGRSIEECAAELGVSVSTAKRSLFAAEAWIRSRVKNTKKRS